MAVIRPDAALPEAARQMRACAIGALPGCDGTRIVSILTKRDLMGQAAAKGRNPKTTRVCEVMTPELIACCKDQESAQALRLMQERQIRLLAVLSRDQRLVGIISLQDVAAAGHEGGLAGGAIRWPRGPGATARCRLTHCQTAQRPPSGGLIVARR